MERQFAATLCVYIRVSTLVANLEHEAAYPSRAIKLKSIIPPSLPFSVLRKIAPVSTTTTSGKSPAAGGGNQASRGKSTAAPGSAADGKASSLSATAKPYVPAPAASSGRGGSSSASSATTKQQSGSQAGKRQQTNSSASGGGQVVNKEPTSAAAAATATAASGVSKRAREGAESARLKPAKTARVTVGEQEQGEIVSEKQAPAASSAGGGEVRLSVLFRLLFFPCLCISVELAVRSSLGYAKGCMIACFCVTATLVNMILSWCPTAPGKHP